MKARPVQPTWFIPSLVDGVIHRSRVLHKPSWVRVGVRLRTSTVNTAVLLIKGKIVLRVTQNNYIYLQQQEQYALTKKSRI